MAAYNYLQLTNSVLRRLREPEASSVNDTEYVKLIATYINDSKRQVEDAYNWNSLSETLSAVTTPNIFNYVLLGSGQRFRVIDIINDTSNVIMTNQTTRWMDKAFLVNEPPKGSPIYYNFNGTDINGDTQVDVYPIPDNVYNLRFNIIKPQVELESNADVLYVPHEPVILGAYARAIAERGEDVGITGNEAYALYLQSLSDAIALEAGRYVEEGEWIIV
jgi:hypothetical protein